MPFIIVKSERKAEQINFSLNAWRSFLFAAWLTEKCYQQIIIIGFTNKTGHNAISLLQHLKESHTISATQSISVQTDKR